jgi:cytochrome b involved in lipid metabolism
MAVSRKKVADALNQSPSEQTKVASGSKNQSGAENLKAFTAKEISLHDSTESLWVVVRNQVRPDLFLHTCSSSECTLCIQIARPTGRSRCAILVCDHTQVYDVTSWISKHPGGDLITLRGGKDCTVLFDSYHPLSAR